MNTILLLAALTSNADVSAGPLRADPQVADRGEVKAGVTLSQTFTLKNDGQTPLTIAEVSGGCGCLRTRISKKELQPAESAELGLELNTLAQSAGPNAWKVTVRYEYGPPGQRAIGEQILSVKAKVVREIAVEPVALFLSIDRAATHAITLTDRRPKPLTLTAARCASKYVKTEIAADRGQGVRKVQVTVLDSCPVGHFLEHVVLLTDDAVYRELRVPLTITRRVPGQVLATPEQIDLRLAKGQLSASGLVRLRDPDDKTVVVERIEADHSAIRFKWAAGPGPMATLRLGVELDGKPMPGLGSVKVHLKEPKPQVIVVPVSWQVP